MPQRRAAVRPPCKLAAIYCGIATFRPIRREKTPQVGFGDRAVPTGFEGARMDGRPTAATNLGGAWSCAARHRLAQLPDGEQRAQGELASHAIVVDGHPTRPGSRMEAVARVLQCLHVRPAPGQLLLEHFLDAADGCFGRFARKAQAALRGPNRAVRATLPRAADKARSACRRRSASTCSDAQRFSPPLAAPCAPARSTLPCFSRARARNSKMRRRRSGVSKTACAATHPATRRRW